MNDTPTRTIRALDELRTDLPPAHDLWPGIAAAIAAPRARHPTWAWARSSTRELGLGLRLGLAATVACLAIGVWIGRASVPTAPPAATSPFAPDARFGAERAALMAQAGTGLATLPPETRRRVEASLATIGGALADIRRALGDDPGNLLLQEMLVNSYQDEIRVLSAVKEAGSAGQEI